MKLKNVTINNYKSFGEIDNFLFLDKLNVIIGKNESGKSNIIDCISKIDMIGFTEKNYFLPKNRKSNKAIIVELFFESYNNEVSLYGFNGTAIVTLNSPNEFLLSGDLSNFILNNKNYNDILNNIDELEVSGLSFSRPETRTKFKEIIEMLHQASSKIFVIPTYYNDFIRTLKNSNIEVQKKVANLIDNAYNFLENLYISFPSFIKIEDLMLSSKYALDKIKQDKLLNQFLEVCQINSDELLNKMNSIDIADVKNYERDINNNIKDYFTNDFNTFYPQESVNIEFSINNKELNVLVDTTKRYLDYDERSNGLKWYISTFIQLQYINKTYCNSSKNNIILMDEPGVYLHANAQKEIVKLLEDLVKNENQIIYTTHSPFMIDTKSLQNIRAVLKDENGFSHIYNKITTIPSNSKSTYDTITPLVNAIGLNLNYNIGPSFNKKNLIVEGISDYFYLQGYYKSKRANKIPNIIPSTGADNITAISSILFGWNCEFNILLDQDDKGRSVFDSINDSKQIFSKKIIFIDGNKEKNLTKDFEIENLFSDSDKSKYGIKNNDYSENKYNYSYLTYNKILFDDESYDKNTIKNFDSMLSKVGD